jgi:hypothetical protein
MAKLAYYQSIEGRWEYEINTIVRRATLGTPLVATL